MTEAKNFYSWFAGLALLAGVLFRWLPESHGFPAFGGDFGNHFVIIELILNGKFFPILDENLARGFSIFNYAPLYSGIITPHLGAISLNQIGIPLTKGMLILTDISILLGAWGIYSHLRRHQASWMFLALGLTAYLLNMCEVISQGFFSQALGLGLGTLGLSLSLQRNRWANPLLLLASICYPDVFLLWAPLLVFHWFNNRTRPFYKSLALGIGIAWVFFLWVLIGRLWRPGIATPPLTPILVLLLIIPFAWSHLQPTHKILLSTFFFVTLLLVTISQFQFNAQTYYAKKIFFWTGTLLALTLPFLQQKKWLVGLSLIVILMAVVIEGDLDKYSQLASADSPFSSVEEVALRKAIQSHTCAHPIIDTNRNFLLFRIMNSFLNRSDFNAEVRLEELNAPKLSEFDAMDLLQNRRDSYTCEMSQSKKWAFCCFKESQPTSAEPAHD